LGLRLIDKTPFLKECEKLNHQKKEKPRKENFRDDNPHPRRGKSIERSMF
jgi:hypothetical protein